MAEEPKMSLHVDSDWKKQAQEEKRKLAEQEAARKKQEQTVTAAPMGVVAGSAAAPSRQAATGQGGARPQEMPQAGLDTLVQSLVTQVLFYLGDIAGRGGEPVVNLDMAKHNLDTLTVLEEKTKGNLTDEEQHMLNAALYEVRMRFIAVATRYAELP
ncbi:MAG: DUF1844 domain-containing protein [Tepidisphaeraceae bacterium]